MSSSPSTSRIRFLSLCVVFVALFIIGRLYVLQVMEHDTYTEKADRQYARSGTSIFNRGSILFTSRNGEEVSAATQQQSAAAQQIASSSQQLDGLVTQLQDSISKFKISEDEEVKVIEKSVQKPIEKQEERNNFSLDDEKRKLCKQYLELNKFKL